MINIPRFETPKIETPKFKFKDPDSITKEILLFLQKASDIANKQFNTSKNLILTTIVIMILQIGYAVWTNYESNSKQSNLSKIIEMQSKQSETISQMSLSLLDLQNQVRILEKQNVKLSKKGSD